MTEETGLESTSAPTTTGNSATEAGTAATGSETATGATGSEATGDLGTTGLTETGDDSGTGEPAGGCGKTPDASGSSTQKISVAGMERTYILSLPVDYDPGTQYPLVFAWHGRGGSAGLAKLYFKVEEASQGQAVFVYPNGLPLADMDDQTGWDLDPANEDFALFDALFTDVQTRLCIDPARIFSTGHSFGGYMSNQLGCHRGDVLRAIGLVAGGGPFGACQGQVATWLAHGNGDMVVPFSEGENSRDLWAAANHCEGPTEPVDPEPCVGFVGCDDGSPVTWCEHAEAALSGHGWPAWAGPAIWEFFAML